MWRAESSTHLCSVTTVKIHCSVLAEDAIKAAITDYKAKHAPTEAKAG
jgi:NifU-like protein involved in Fe-S cluster formation